MAVGTDRKPERTTVGELEREHAALVQVQLVLVRLGDVQHFYIPALHAHRQPLSCRKVTQREDLERGGERGRERREGGREGKRDRTR